MNARVIHSVMNLRCFCHYAQLKLGKQWLNTARRIDKICFNAAAKRPISPIILILDVFIRARQSKNLLIADQFHRFFHADMLDQGGTVL